MATISSYLGDTTSSTIRRRAHDYRMFVWLALAMAATVVTGFSLQWLAGRSSFVAAPWRLHLHAMLFMGWVGLFVVQTLLAAGMAGRGSLALHRRLGWLGAGWATAMVVVGIVTTVSMVRRAAVPFFFTPAYFLAMDGLAVLWFGGLVAAAIALRRRTAWHNRLMIVAMTILTGPAVGRLIPAPLLMPWVGLTVFAVILVFPVAGIVGDRVTRGRVHPAWWVGLAALATMQAAIELLPRSAAGLAAYRAVVHGSAGAAVDPRAYPPFPPL